MHGPRSVRGKLVLCNVTVNLLRVKACSRPAYGPTVTLSNVDVFNAVLLCAVTARPSCALLAIVTLIEPTCVQVVPSAEVNPVNVLPERTSRTQ